MSNIVDIAFINEVKELLNAAKEKAKVAINVAMVYTYYEIGRRIVDQEQKGENRAEYGKEVLKQLSTALTKEFGKGYSVSNLKMMRQFYSVYSADRIGQPLVSELKSLPTTSDGKRFFLGWALYIQLMRIDNPDERHFYEIEAYKNNWSKRELARQIDSALYERLALSRDKQKVLELSQKGQIIEKPLDAIKDPYILEFLNLREDDRYSEKDLETRIINKLQYFLLELGKGFTFVQRQMRLSFGDQHFFADLVFYNRILRCFVVIDLKIGKLKHQDIGQMQMYVNYFDRYVKLPDENKTIGILLCRKKDDAVVELTLPKDNDQIFASKYETVLPTKEELLKLIEEK
ncbi:MAG: DUF1016 family protein [Bacilli bacterium]|nr:DUF1016 family protein [Bacilli bacterium]